MIKKTSTDNQNEEDFVFEDEGEDGAIAEKLKNLRAKLKVAEEEKMANLAGWQRAQADYSNLKGQTAKEREGLAEIITATVIDDFIPIADSFEMAMGNKTAWEAVPENWRRGVEYIYSQLENVLISHGVVTINPLGKPFDPLEHQSVGVIETTNPAEDHVVLEVVKKGYRLGEKVIRPAQVKIGEVS